MKGIGFVLLGAGIAFIVFAVITMAAWNRDSHGMRYKVVDYTASPNGLWSTYYTDNTTLAFGVPTMLNGYWHWKSWNPGTLIIPANHTLLIE